MTRGEGAGCCGAEEIARHRDILHDRSSLFNQLDIDLFETGFSGQGRAKPGIGAACNQGRKQPHQTRFQAMSGNPKKLATPWEP